MRLAGQRLEEQLILSNGLARFSDHRAIYFEDSLPLTHPIITNG